MWKRLRSLFRVLAARPAFEHDMGEELQFHIEEYANDLAKAGMPRDEALRRARIEFGGFNSVKADCRRERGLQVFDEFGRELRYAVRQLRKTPAFTITALFTIALCLGANLTIFAVIDSVLLRPLPFPDAGGLVTIFNTYPKAGVERDGSSLTNYYERRGRIPAFSSLSIYRFETAIVGEPGSTVREQVTLISPEFFTTLGLQPAIGRAFTEEETTPETNRVVILTDDYWRQRFHADPRVVGRHIRVNGIATTIAGVLPQNFRFLSSEARLYFPLASRPEQRSPRERHSGGNVTQMIARLKPGATVAEAQAQIDAQNATLEKDDPQANMMADAGFRSLVVPLHTDQVAAIRPTLLLLQAGVLLLLLIGTVNLVNLLLVRASGRVKETAVRQALGASGAHIVSEVGVEIALLTLAGALLGVLVSGGGIRLLAALGSDRLPLGTYIAFDGRLLPAALIAAVVMALVLAFPIAWFTLRRHLHDALQSETRNGTAGRAAQKLRHSFIVAQIALAFVLLAGAGLLALSLKRVMAVSPGFQPTRVLTGQISLPSKDYPNGADRLAFTEKLMEELGQQPGVVASGVVTNVPFSGNSGKSAATVIGHLIRPGESPRGHYSYGVTGEYFRAMGFSLSAGRFLTESDSRRGQRVCVVDEDFARYYWPNGSAVGQRLFQGSSAGPDGEAFTVVGVVGSVKQAGLTDDAAQGAIYYPYVFRGDDNIFIAIRGAVPPKSLGTTLQKIVRGIDAGLPVNNIQSMDARIADSLVARRSPALLAGLFSGIALLLIGVGTYGVLSYSVAQRRREIGVRMALGARPEQIRREFVLMGIRLLAGGVFLGLLGSWVAGRAMQALLYHVAAWNMPVLAGACAIIAVASLAACLVPASRAARTSPMQALAEE